MMMENGEDFSLYLTRSDHAPLYNSLNGSFHELTLSSPNKAMQQLERSLFESSLAFKTTVSDERFCTEETVEKCVAQLNQEVTSMGMLSLYTSGEEQCDIVRLINCTHSLLLKHQASLKLREELENKIHRVSCDGAHLRQSLQRAQEKSELEKREITAVQNKLSQVSTTNSQLSLKVKTLQDEVKRVKMLMQHRDTQHKHDIKKKERELTKLRDRLNQLLGGRGKNSIQQAAIHMSLGLQRTDGKRGTWKTASNAKNEEDLYKAVLLSAEDKFKSVLVENSSLRRCLSSVQHEISLLLNTNNNNVDSDSFIEGSEGQSSEGQMPSDSSDDSFRSDRVDGLYEMPYELSSTEINTVFKDQLRELRRLTRRADRHKDKSVASPSHLQKRRASGDFCLSPSRRTSSLNHLDDNRQTKEIEKLQKQVSRYQSIIDEQEKLIEQSLEAQKTAAEASLRLRSMKEASPGKVWTKSFLSS